MAGKGSRFIRAGYNLPKFLVQTHGTTIFEWAMKSLPLQLADQIIFICLKEHLDNYQKIFTLIDKVSNDIPYKIIDTLKVTKGQLCSVMKAEEFIDNQKDLIIYNIDTYFISKTLKEKLYSARNQNIDGVLGVFRDSSEKWSFAKIGLTGYVEKTAEKRVISHIALTGLYHFTRGSDFVRVAKKAIADNLKVDGEFYIAPIYNLLIHERKKFIVDMVDEFWCIGTPEDLQYFEANFKSK